MNETNHQTRELTETKPAKHAPGIRPIGGADAPMVQTVPLDQSQARRKPDRSSAVAEAVADRAASATTTKEAGSVKVALLFCVAVCAVIFGVTLFAQQNTNAPGTRPFTGITTPNTVPVQVNASNGVITYPPNFWSVNAAALANAGGLVAATNGLAIGLSQTNGTTSAEKVYDGLTVLSGVAAGNGSGWSNLSGSIGTNQWGIITPERFAGTTNIWDGVTDSRPYWQAAEDAVEFLRASGQMVELRATPLKTYLLSSNIWIRNSTRIVGACDTMSGATVPGGGATVANPTFKLASTNAAAFICIPALTAGGLYGIHLSGIWIDGTLTAGQQGIVFGATNLVSGVQSATLEHITVTHCDTGFALTNTDSLKIENCFAYLCTNGLIMTQPAGGGYNNNKLDRFQANCYGWAAQIFGCNPSLYDWDSGGVGANASGIKFVGSRASIYNVHIEAAKWMVYNDSSSVDVHSGDWLIGGGLVALTNSGTFEFYGRPALPFDANTVSIYSWNSGVVNDVINLSPGGQSIKITNVVAGTTRTATATSLVQGTLPGNQWYYAQPTEAYPVGTDAPATGGALTNIAALYGGDLRFNATFARQIGTTTGNGFWNGCGISVPAPTDALLANNNAIPVVTDFFVPAAAAGSTNVLVFQYSFPNDSGIRGTTSTITLIAASTNSIQTVSNTIGFPPGGHAWLDTNAPIQLQWERNNSGELAPTNVFWLRSRVQY